MADDIPLEAPRLTTKATAWQKMLDGMTSVAAMKKRFDLDLKSLRPKDLVSLARYFYAKYLQLPNEKKTTKYEFLCNLLEEAIKYSKDPDWVEEVPKKIEPLYSFLAALDYFLNFQKMEKRFELEATYYNYLHQKFRGQYIRQFPQAAVMACSHVNTAPRSEMILLKDRLNDFYKRKAKDEIFYTRDIYNYWERLVEDKNYMLRLQSEKGSEKMMQIFLKDTYLHRGLEYFEKLHSFLQDSIRQEKAKHRLKVYKYGGIAREMESFLHKKHLTGSSEKSEEEPSPPRAPRPKRIRGHPTGSPIMSSSHKRTIPKYLDDIGFPVDSSMHQRKSADPKKKPTQGKISPILQSKDPSGSPDRIRSPRRVNPKKSTDPISPAYKRAIPKRKATDSIGSPPKMGPTRRKIIPILKSTDPSDSFDSSRSRRRVSQKKSTDPISPAYKRAIPKRKATDPIGSPKKRGLTRGKVIPKSKCTDPVGSPDRSSNRIRRKIRYRRNSTDSISSPSSTGTRRRVSPKTKSSDPIGSPNRGSTGTRRRVSPKTKSGDPIGSPKKRGLTRGKVILKRKCTDPVCSPNRIRRKISYRRNSSDSISSPSRSRSRGSTSPVRKRTDPINSSAHKRAIPRGIFARLSGSGNSHV